MTFEARELSTQDGAPVELYMFALDTRVWRYTSSDREIESGGHVFKPRPITRSNIESTNEKARLGLTLRAPRSLEVAELYIITPPTQAVTLVVQQFHQGDSEVATIWTGRIVSVDFTGGIAAEITLEPVYTSIRRIGLRRLYQRQCPHVLFGPACKVDKAAHRIDGTIASISGTVVSVSAVSGEADGWAAGGYLEWTVDGATDRRFIDSHTGAALDLGMSTYGLSVGMAVSVYPGCDHTIATCNSKFANEQRFGGFPYFPQKNPFDGTPIY